MRFEVKEFIIVLALNLLAVILYGFWSVKSKRAKRRGFILRSIVMLLCPVVGPAYFFLGWIWQTVFFYKPVNLEDVLFSKERESILVKAEEEKDKNLVPVEEALLVSDKQNARSLFLDVIKRDPKKSLHSISLALNSEDSELSHYAASIIQSELDKIRKAIRTDSDRILALEEELARVESERGWIRTIAGTQFIQEHQSLVVAGGSEEALDSRQKKYYADIASELEASVDYSRHNALAFVQGQEAMRGEDYEEEKNILQELTEEMQKAHAVIQEIDNLLKQKLLSDFESKLYTETLNKIARIIEKRDVLSSHEIEVVVENNIKAKDFEMAEEWYQKSFFYYPHDIFSHRSRLQVLYAKDDREGFLAALNELKISGIPLDHELVDTVRFFS